MLEKTLIPQDYESQLTQEWEKNNPFVYEKEAAGQPYCIIMPPPNVTGSLHMGHALTYTLQDILIRYHRKKGKNVLWQPGTDHAGIATQMVVERLLDQEGTSRHDLGRENFLKRVWEWKAFSGNTIQTQLKRLGASVPWHRDCFTMDPQISDAVRKVFVQLHRDGLIYRDKRIVNWDVKLQSAVSDLEVNNKPIPGALYHIRYPFVDNPQEGIVIATTRPETLFGDVAVFVHPEDPRYQSFIGRQVVVPFVNRPVPIIGDEMTAMDMGTGALKVTPAHDPNDFEAGKRHHLPAITIFDVQGILRDPVPAPFCGLDRFEARKQVVEHLKALELLVVEEAITHAVPHGDRSDTILEPRLTDQWFVNAPVLAKPAIEAVESGKTQFLPAFWTATYFEWMRNIQPWCISRQIWWGHRIPAWYGPDGSIFVEETESKAQEAAAAHYGKSVALHQETDVLDTWFSAGLWPFVTLDWPQSSPELKVHYPSSVLITGNDIIFFWVARMMMMGLYIMKDVPFKDVYIHALVRDEKGQKMSKSKGNVVDPSTLMDTYGADSLRFTLALQAAPGRDIKFAPSRIEGVRNFMTKLWNAVRYCHMNQAFGDASPFTESFPDVQHPVNLWMMDRLMRLRQLQEKALEEYRFHEAAQNLYQEIWGTFCDWYLEFTKPLLQDPAPAILLETRLVMRWAVDQFLHLLNPFMPFLTEHIWKMICSLRQQKETPLLAKLPYPPLPDAAKIDRVQLKSVSWIQGFIEEIRSMSALLGLPPGLKSKGVFYTTDLLEQQWLKDHDAVVCRMARLQLLTVESVQPPLDPLGSVAIPYGNGTFICALGDVLDIEKEVVRIAQEVERLEKEALLALKKLENADFVNKAPPEIVEELRTRHHECQQKIEKLQEARHRLGGKLCS